MDLEEANRRKLNALKLSSFDWVKGLDDVWNLSRWDVPALHRRAEEEFSQEVVQILSRSALASPPGMILSGPGGSGKTHLLSRFCRIALLNRGYFLLADMSGEGEGFMETVLAGMVRSLSTPVALLEGRTQASVAAETLLTEGGFLVPADFPGRHTRANPQKLNRDLEKLRDKLQLSWPREAAEHSECLRSIFLMNSRDALLRRAASDWLAGRQPDPEAAAAAGFRSGRGAPDRAVAGLSYCLSLGGRYAVLAMDQMDHLSALFGIISRCGPGEGAHGLPAEARAQVADYSDGLGRLTGLTRRTIAVVSCLPPTWENLCALSLNTALERYRRPPVFLSPIGNARTAMSLVEARMKTPCRRAGFQPPHPGWPFSPGAFDDAVGMFPRALMERCHQLVRERVLDGDPEEITSLAPPGSMPSAGFQDQAAHPYADDDLVEATPAAAPAQTPTGRPRLAGTSVQPRPETADTGSGPRAAPRSAKATPGAPASPGAAQLADPAAAGTASPRPDPEAPARTALRAARQDPDPATLEVEAPDPETQNAVTPDAEAPDAVNPDAEAPNAVTPNAGGPNASAPLAGKPSPEKAPEKARSNAAAGGPPDRSSGGPSPHGAPGSLAVPGASPRPGTGEVPSAPAMEPAGLGSDSHWGLGADPHWDLGEPPVISGREPGDTMVFVWNDDDDLRGYLESSVLADLQNLSSLELADPDDAPVASSAPAAPAVACGKEAASDTPAGAGTAGTGDTASGAHVTHARKAGEAGLGTFGVQEAGEALEPGYGGDGDQDTWEPGYGSDGDQEAGEALEPGCGGDGAEEAGEPGCGDDGGQEPRESGEPGFGGDGAYEAGETEAALEPGDVEDLEDVEDVDYWPDEDEGYTGEEAHFGPSGPTGPAGDGAWPGAAAGHRDAADATLTGLAPGGTPGSAGDGTAISPHGIYTWQDEAKEPEEDPVFATERRFQELFRDADTEPFRDEEAEEGVWPEALRGFLAAFAESRKGLGGPSIVVSGPQEGTDPPPYHVLVLAEGRGIQDGGRRLYIRALLRSNPKAFTSRLTRALDAAEIDRMDRGVRLALVRFTPKPSGEVTSEAVDSFGTRGGLWLKPSDADLSLLKASGDLSLELPRQGYLNWMRAFQPWRRLLFLAADLEWLSGDSI
jgi:hypothetical protein